MPEGDERRRRLQGAFELVGVGAGERREALAGAGGVRGEVQDDERAEVDAEVDAGGEAGGRFGWWGGGGEVLDAGAVGGAEVWV